MTPAAMFPPPPGRARCRAPTGRGPAAAGASWQRRWAAVLLAAALAAACGQRPSALAVVGKRPVTLEDVERVVQQETGKPLAQVAPELAAALFESYLEEEVVLAASPDPADRDLPFAARSMRARQLLAQLCPPPAEPSPAEIAARLAQRAPAGERVLLRQLILPDLATARLARQRLEAGEDFVAVSKELSRAPNAAEGGAIGWVERGQLVPEFEAVIFGLGEGGVSQPVASNSGWHVFQVTARRGAGSSDASRVRVREELMGEAAERSRRACLRQLAAKVGVTVPCTGAPFPCRNPFEESS